jgi:glycosyltransferase involved in cell wall biosynthesis
VNQSLPLRVLIVSEHASAQFGGEAALPLHYFRVLRNRGVDVWLITHSRTRDELARLYPDEKRIHYIEDTRLHWMMWRIGSRLPAQISYFTTGFISRFSTQMAQRRIVRRLLASERIDVIHQPMPVSPREPSMMYGFGVPVVIGPMNGGMDYPPNFRRHRGGAERVLLGVGRWSAGMLNWLMPGKRKAAALLVANQRTQKALPRGVCPQVIEIVENGVDLSLWRAPSSEPSVSPAGAGDVATFVFLGRLVEWKAVDLLVNAFKRACARAPMRLMIIGDGDERVRLQVLAESLGILDPGNVEVADNAIHFKGWLPQQACAQELQQAHCLVLPSLLECGGAVVLEAMSMGKPVIATAWGGPLDYLDDSCGILVLPRDRESLINGLADAMVRLATSPEEREQMGRNGRAKVLRDYDWEVKVDRILQVYRDAMDGRFSVTGPVSSRTGPA